MRPPLPPVVSSFHSPNNARSYRPGYEDLIPPGHGLSPQLHDPLALLGSSGNTASQQDNCQLPSLRGTESLRRYYDDDSGPWTPQRMNVNSGQPPMGRGYASFHAQHTPYGPIFNEYREIPQSEMSASINGQDRLDSGYGTKSVMSNSERSANRLDQSQGCPSITGEIGRFQVNENMTRYDPEPDYPQEDQYSSFDGMSDTSSRQPRATGSLTCGYDNCTHSSKNPSEHK